jgi:hypothetical protein
MLNHRKIELILVFQFGILDSLEARPFSGTSPGTNDIKLLTFVIHKFL